MPLKDKTKTFHRKLILTDHETKRLNIHLTERFPDIKNPQSRQYPHHISNALKIIHVPETLYNHCSQGFRPHRPCWLWTNPSGQPLNQASSHRASLDPKRALILGIAVSPQLQYSSTCWWLGSFCTHTVYFIWLCATQIYKPNWARTWQEDLSQSSIYPINCFWEQPTANV